VAYIQVRKLYKRYGSLEVLKDLDLDIFEGETLVILGRSGVGKSVLLRQLIGLEVPESGAVVIDGVDITTLSYSKRLAFTKHMGMLFQGAALFDSMNVYENTAFFLRQHEGGLKESEVKKRVDEALQMVDLKGTGEKMPSDLSGGMRKRAALARLIVYRPKILLYDEPTTGLDPITSMQINQLILKTQRELKATSIVVTHDIKSAITVGNRIAFHEGGKIFRVETKEEFMKKRSDTPLLSSFFDNAIITEEFLKGGGAPSTIPQEGTEK
jgi:phospholipid/cholesterol/gamma-HCH transport system ATP-binding protein